MAWKPPEPRGFALGRSQPRVAGERAARAPEGWIVLVAAALLAVAVWTAAIAEVSREVHLPWWGLAPIFALAERAIAHVRLRRLSYLRLPLREVPLTAGILYSDPEHLLLAAVFGIGLGRLLAGGVGRRSIPFDAAPYALGAGTAALLAGLVGDGGAPMNLLDGVAVTCAVALGAAVGLAFQIRSLASLRNGHARSTGLEIGLRLLVGAGQAAVVVAGVAVAAADLRALPLLIVPVYIFYRRFLEDPQRQGRLELLYEASRLALRPEVAGALEDILRRALGVFRADVAELTLFPGGSARPVSMRLRVGEEEIPVEPSDLHRAEEFGALVEPDRPVAVASRASAPDRVAARIAEMGARHVIVALLGGAERIGTLVLGSGGSAPWHVTRDERDLLEALGLNISAALQQEHLSIAVERLEEIEDGLRHRAYHDPLTKLANRWLLDTRIQERSRAGAPDCALVFVDVDDFKAINDRLGHEAGDELLVTIARRIAAAVRPGDLVARMGGDEFAILLGSEHDPELRARAVAGRLLAAFDEPVELRDHLVMVRVTMGIAAGCPADELLARADTALHEAKGAGKSRFALFEERMREERRKRRRAGVRLVEAIRRGLLTVEYQPIIDVASWQPVAAEVYARWNDSEQGPVSPGDFIPLAEDLGVARELGELVLERTCAQIVAWDRKFGSEAPRRVHVNLSATEAADAGLAAAAVRHAQRAGIGMERLAFDVSEVSIASDPAGVERTLGALADAGAHLALDDFGAGSAALRSLTTMPFGSVKIAGSLVAGIGGERSRDEEFVRLVSELAHLLALRVIAEGVETRAQARALSALGCEEAQGFFLGYPVPPDRWPPSRGGVSAGGGEGASRSRFGEEPVEGERG